MGAESELISAKDVCRRYSISEMTLYRWLKDTSLNFPRPAVFRRRRYFYAEELRAWERSRTGGAV